MMASIAPNECLSACIHKYCDVLLIFGLTAEPAENAEQQKPWPFLSDLRGECFICHCSYEIAYLVLVVMRDSLNVQHQMIPIIEIFQPSVISVGFGIKFFDIGLDVQQWRAVEDIQP